MILLTHCYPPVMIYVITTQKTMIWGRMVYSIAIHTFHMQFSSFAYIIVLDFFVSSSASGGGPHGLFSFSWGSWKSINWIRRQ